MQIFWSKERKYDFFSKLFCVVEMLNLVYLTYYAGHMQENNDETKLCASIPLFKSVNYFLSPCLSVNKITTIIKQYTTIKAFKIAKY